MSAPYIKRPQKTQYPLASLPHGRWLRRITNLWTLTPNFKTPIQLISESLNTSFTNILDQHVDGLKKNNVSAHLMVDFIFFPYQTRQRQDRCLCKAPFIYKINQSALQKKSTKHKLTWKEFNHDPFKTIAKHRVLIKYFQLLYIDLLKKAIFTLGMNIFRVKTCLTSSDIPILAA